MDIRAALTLFEDGKFKESRLKFEELRSSTSKVDEKNFCSFNISSCYAEEGNYEEAKSHMDKLNRGELRGFDRNALMYNSTLCTYEMFRCKNALSDDRYQEEAGTLEQMIDYLNQIDRQSEYFQSTCDLVKSFIDQIAANLWSKSKYTQSEKLFRRAERIVSEEEDHDYHERLQRDLGHILFMMDTRFEDTVHTYEALLPDGEESLLGVAPDLLANLCVAYVLTGRNLDAEQLIKETELAQFEYKEFDYDSEGQPDSAAPTEQSLSHLDKINLAIGTLYCVKGNYEFGLGRIFKTMEPMKDKQTINPTSWFHAKRCILAMLARFCKLRLCLHDGLCELVVKFLIDCEKFGDQLSSKTNETSTNNQTSEQVARATTTANRQRTIAEEARLLRSLMVSVIHD